MRKFSIKSGFLLCCVELLCIYFVTSTSADNSSSFLERDLLKSEENKLSFLDSYKDILEIKEIKNKEIKEIISELILTGKSYGNGSLSSYIKSQLNLSLADFELPLQEVAELPLYKQVKEEHIEKCQVSSFQEIIYSIYPTENFTDIYNITSDGSKIYNTPKGSNGTNSKQCNCIVVEREEILDVKVVNDTDLNEILTFNPNITSRSMPATCFLIYFFSPFCPFSAQGSAYVNALAKSIENVPVYGLNSMQDHGVNARYGVMGTPSLFLFHNGIVAGRYNSSDFTTSQLESFVGYYTNQNIKPITVSSNDFKCDLPSITKQPSLVPLYIAWVFLISCGSWMFFTSKVYMKLIETFLNNWREAEAHHAHHD